MTDIVKRLRNSCSCNFPDTPCGAEDECRAAFEAADEIERLRAALDSTDAAKTLWENKAKKHLSRIEHLEAALQDIIADSFSFYAIEVARAALKEGRT